MMRASAAIMLITAAVLMTACTKEEIKVVEYGSLTLEGHAAPRLLRRGATATWRQTAHRILAHQSLCHMPLLPPGADDRCMQQGCHQGVGQAQRKDTEVISQVTGLTIEEIESIVRISERF